MAGMFGNQDQKGGAKVPSQNEWNELNNSLTNVSYGSNGFFEAEVSEMGINIPSDSFFFPHTATISGDYQHAIIGIDREEDYYPYIDNVGFIYDKGDFGIVKNGGEYILDVDNQLDISVALKTVVFPELNYTIPITPLSAVNGVIVGYEWNIVPNIVITGGALDGSFLLCQIRWEPETIFNQLSAENSIYSEEYTQDLSQEWGSSSTPGTSSYNLSSLINEGLLESTTFSGLYPLTFPDIYSTSIIYNNKVTRLPVARYDWEGDELARVIQLYFGGSIGAGGGTGGTSSTTELAHPFKGQISAVTTGLTSGAYVVIGSDRADDAYTFKDSITVLDQTLNNFDTLFYGQAESLLLSTSGDNYVYYTLSGNNGTWTSELNVSDSYPPSGEYSDQLLYHLIGYANYTSGTVATWGQECFSCPTLYVPHDLIKDSINGHIETPTDKTYVLSLNPYTSGFVQSVTTDCATGTADSFLVIEGVSGAFNTPITFSTTETSFTAVSANVYKPGDKISLEIHESTNLTDAYFTVRLLRDTQR